nr:hypothetical protein [Tanacetum cinerariifolium]
MKTGKLQESETVYRTSPRVPIYANFSRTRARVFAGEGGGGIVGVVGCGGMEQKRRGMELQNDNEVISEVTGVEQGGETVEQYPTNFEKTRALYDSLYQNLATEVEKVNSQAQKKQQSLYDGKVLHAKLDPIVVHDSEETLQLAQESREKMKQMNKEIKPANYTKIIHLLGVFVPQTALSREELYFSNISKTANVSKSISIPNEDLSDDTTPSVARKFLNEKLENANVELEFKVLNYACENAHLKATYKNLFDSISVSRVQTKTKIASLQNELQCNIYKNAKLRTQLFKKVSDQKDNTQDTSKNTKFAKQLIAEILPKISETNALSKPVTSNFVSTPPVSK